MTNWIRAVDIPPAAVESITPSLEALEAAFRPLMAKLPFTTEPAITLSEAAVIGE